MAALAIGSYPVSMKSVVICSSNRFAKEARAFAKALEKLGVTVYVPHYYRASGGNWDAIAAYDKQFVALGLTLDHFNKMRLADVVLVYNKDGYAGNSTSMEIGYAAALDKPIFAISDKDDDMCRSVLFRGIVASPKEFIKFLR